MKFKFNKKVMFGAIGGLIALVLVEQDRRSPALQEFLNSDEEPFDEEQVKTKREDIDDDELLELLEQEGYFDS